MERGKVNVDELVNSLLLERQSGVTAKSRIENPSAIPQSQPMATMPMDGLIIGGSRTDMRGDEPMDLLSYYAPEETDPVKILDDEILAALAGRTVTSSMADATPEVEAEVVPMDADPAPQSFADATSDEDEAPVEEAPAPVVAPVRKRKKLFARKVEDTETLEQSWSDWGVTPIGSKRNEEATASADVVGNDEDNTSVADPVERYAMPEDFPAVSATTETTEIQGTIPRDDDSTRVIVATDIETKLAVDVPIDVEEQLPDQLSLEEMVRVEDIETDGEPDQMETEPLDPEEKLQRSREEKVREFTLNGEEEESESDGALPEEEEVEIEDYTSYQETQTVAAELKYRCRTSLLSLIFSSVLELGLLLATLLTVAVEQPPIPVAGYLIIHLFALLLIMGLNYSTLVRGFSGLFTLRANNDTAPAVAGVVCLVDVILHLMNPAIALPFWTPLAGLILVMSAAGHYAHEMCVQRNFSFVSHPSDKYAAAVIEEEGALQEIGRRAVSDGEASVAYFRRTDFLTDFLTNAYDEDRSDDWSRLLTPIALGIVLLTSLLSFLGESVSNAWDWLTVFTGMICMAMPVTLLAVQMPLSRTCRHMLSRGGFLNGWKAVDCFGEPDALVVDVADLYPDESMKLHGIKTFSGAHIDEVLLTAASLVVRSGGPLSMIFRRIIENNEDLLYEVDSLVYEQGMGLSGWVDGRRVFVGNGRLLQNHGVDVPSADYEARYMKDGRRLVYLAIGGQLSAMFVVSYLADPDIQSALQDLCRSRVTLLVRSCDPNITTSDLCDCFELDEYYVDVLPASAGRQYMQLTESKVESLPAVMASNGHILGTARVLFACHGLKTKATIALLVQTAAAALGVLLCLWWALQGTLSLFQPLVLMLVSFLLTWLAPLFRRI